MDKKIWLIKETFKNWDSPDLYQVVPNKKSLIYYFDDKSIEIHKGDIFFGVDKNLKNIYTIGVSIGNSFILSNKSAVFLLPKYFFGDKVPFKDFALWILGQQLDIDTVKEKQILELSVESWNDILNHFKKEDNNIYVFLKYLEVYHKQREYLENILAILDEFECDYNERQEIFLILRNLLNWNPEYTEGQGELEEMLTFLRYSLHIEDLNYEKRSEILDKLIYNWIQYVNFLPKNLIESLQDIRKNFIL